MQKAAALLAELGDSVEAVRVHLSTLDRGKLEGLVDILPTTLAAGSAEMVMLVLLYREIQTRRSEDGTVLPFPTTTK